MKRILIIIIAIIAIRSTLSFGENNRTSNQQKKITNKLIRFHVIANSDLDRDQKLKLQVKNKVLECIQPKLKKCKNINESRELLKQNNKNIKEIAEEIIKNKGYNYSVNTELSFEKFPVKTYGNITLPSGNYEAYRIIIGEGKGKNWWCIMFPPLCFVDITKGEISYKQTEEEMRNILDEEEYKSIDNRYNTKKIKFKFKILDKINNILS